MQQLTVQTKSGPQHFPHSQFELNSEQQFACIGIDFDEFAHVELGNAAMKTTRLGKLREQGFIFQCQIENSLRTDHWNFEDYPNPEIILLESTMKVGQWIITMEGKLVKIRNQQDVARYSNDFSRVAGDQEVPEFHFTLLPGQNLGKQNFWDPLREKCPMLVQRFCDFIDRYKDAVGWNERFGEKVKFHDIPVEMQIGIICNFLGYYSPFNLYSASSPAECVKQITETFAQVEVQSLNTGVAP
jgi:hypothetical protein